MDRRPEYKHAEVTEQIIRAFYTVYNTLGYGFLERVYVKALLLELKKLGLAVGHEVAIEVLYSGEVIGEYFADLIVNGVVIVEVKAARILAEEHEAQLLNYLKATGFEVGFLLNFGPKAEIRRKAFDNALKGRLTWAAKP
ncbi:MAG TPA: GxxExxY protein [Terriglobia bacterium]|nr:GxxExxY protein [Terriglobia bacterium]